MPDGFTVAVVLAAAGLGGCVQGLAGFGSTVVALPILGLALGMRVAVPVGCLLALAMNLLLATRLRRRVDGRALGVLLGASLPGMALGVLVWRWVPVTALQAGLGLLTLWLAATAWGRSRPGGARVGAGTGLGLAAGLAAGCLGVTLGINGPPVVAWAVRQGWPRAVFVATLNAYFLLAGIGIVGLQAAGGLLTPGVWELFAAGCVAVWAGVRLGTALCPRLDEAVFRLAVRGVLAVTGAGLVWRAARALAG